MSEKEKKKIKVCISILVVCVLAFVIYWNATEDDRYRKGQILEVQQEIEDYRSGENTYITFIFTHTLMQDHEFGDFLVSQVQELYANKEIPLLSSFIKEIDGDMDDLYYRYLLDAITDGFMKLESLDDALALVDSLEFCHYYNQNLVLTRDSPILVTYIGKHGENPITMTPGEGYYADEEDTSSRHRVGIQGSALYDAESVTHLGDFKCCNESGVSLNRSTYTEQHYSRTTYYFRDSYLTFSPYEGECVWSGDYLFCFSDTGELLYFAKV